MWPYTQENYKVTAYIKGKPKAEKRPEKTSGLHFRLILGREIVSNNQKTKQTTTKKTHRHTHTQNTPEARNKQKKTANPEEGGESDFQR